MENKKFKISLSYLEPARKQRLLKSKAADLYQLS